MYDSIKFNIQSLLGTITVMKRCTINILLLCAVMNVSDTKSCTAGLSSSRKGQ